MDKITEFLKRETGARLDYNARWLIWEEEWQVFERLPHARKTTTLYTGDNLGLALDYLKDMWNEGR